MRKIQPYNESLDTSKTPDDLQNLGDVFKNVKGSKIQTRINQLQTKISEAKILIKHLTPDHSLQELRPGIIEFLKVFYSDKALDQEIKKLDDYSDSEYAISRMYNILLFRMDSLQKEQANMDIELGTFG